jgi:hypothetical protein
MTACRTPGARFGLRVAFYAAILLGLLVVYSSGADPGAGFVYTNF